MRKSLKPPTKIEKEAKQLAAWHRGWTDSLTAYYAVSEQPWEDKFDYLSGWWACANARHSRSSNPQENPL